MIVAHKMLIVLDDSMDVFSYLNELREERERNEREEQQRRTERNENEREKKKEREECEGLTRNERECVCGLNRLCLKNLFGTTILIRINL